MYAIGYPLHAAVVILNSLLLIYTFVIIAAVILSWVNPDPLNPIVRILRNMTEPAMEKLRPYVPLIGGLDLTPVVLIVLLSFVRLGVLPVLARLAQDMT
ncbi:MAG: YggT family protein [Pseudomonadaceae bacterium]|nr:YggT family protein [Pseudomonadaceae bacterium]